MVVTRYKLEIPITVRYELEGEGPTMLVTVRFMGRQKTAHVGDLPHESVAERLLREILVIGRAVDGAQLHRDNPE